ncbi:DUF4352 domain-containing protein [Chloroflexota bacterium]
MKRLILALIMVTLVTAVGCSSALSQGDEVSDTTHSFLLNRAQIVDRINGDSPPEGKAYLVITYQVSNLQSRQDASQRWVDRVILETNKEQYPPTFFESLESQMWETSLAPAETKTGYIAFTVPDTPENFHLSVTLPTSGNEMAYQLNPVDKRISVNIAYVLTRFEQIERTQGIPVVGGSLAAFTSAPIRYMGIILVPKEEVPQLMAQAKGLSQAAKEDIIANYLLPHGHGSLE